MTKLEVRLFAELSARELSNGCSDYILPNDNEHWAIVEAALAANVRKTVEQWRADVDDIEYRKRPKGKTINTDDYLILGHLRDKAIRELTEAAT